MFNYFREICVGFSFVLMITSSQANAQDRLPDSLEVRGECRKTNGNGCTAYATDNTVCRGAPAGWVIVGRSVQYSNNAYGRGILCRPELRGRTVLDHVTGPMELFTEICLGAQIESGGGGRKIGTIFYNTCSANYNIVRRSALK